jgi:hypothetical protein
MEICINKFDAARHAEFIYSYSKYFLMVFVIRLGEFSIFSIAEILVKTLKQVQGDVQPCCYRRNA